MNFLANSYRRVIALLNLFANPLLLFIRVYFGWQIAQAGFGKLEHLDRAAGFFASISIPAPHFTALFVGLVEFLGGIFLALGVGSRITALFLFATMTVAYWTADRDAFLGVFTDPDKFTAAGPYTIWFAALLILILGPGKWALDTLLARFWPSEPTTH